MRVTGFICGHRIYEYKGWVFEVPAMAGPWPLKKDGEPRARAGKKFYDIWSQWDQLTKEEKQKTCINGGCIPI